MVFMLMVIHSVRLSAVLPIGITLICFQQTDMRLECASLFPDGLSTVAQRKAFDFVGNEISGCGHIICTGQACHMNIFTLGSRDRQIPELSPVLVFINHPLAAPNSVHPFFFTTPDEFVIMHVCRGRDRDLQNLVFIWLLE